jgi:hypothetical protein
MKRTAKHAAPRAVVAAAVLCCGLAQAVAAVTPFTFTAPDFLASTHVTRSLMGDTHAWLARDSKRHTRLLLTTMRVADIRARFGSLTDLQCVNLFLDELRATYQDFFVIAMNHPLRLGPTEFIHLRWTGDTPRATLTGVLSCGELAGYYYVVHFVDELKAATRSFPAIRAALRALQPTTAGAQP